MAKKDLEIHCPDCGSRLRIDPQSGKIIAHGADKAQDLKTVQTRMAGQAKQREDAFGAALDAERGRRAELDNLFKKAAEKTQDSSSEEAPPDNPMDERWR